MIFTATANLTHNNLLVSPGERFEVTDPAVAQELIDLGLVIDVSPIETPFAEPPATPTRIQELETLLELEGWDDIKAIATKLGLTKPRTTTWREFIPTIVEAEAHA